MKTNIVIVGTKCDRLDREVTEEEGKKLADELGVKYFETSAKTGYNVNEAYNFLIKNSKLLLLILFYFQLLN